jgi:hypothetical protein
LASAARTISTAPDRRPGRLCDRRRGAASHETQGDDALSQVTLQHPCGQGLAAGDLPGDILLSLDGQQMTEPGSLRSLLGPERIGRKVEIHGQIRTRWLIIAEQPGLMAR